MNALFCHSKRSEESSRATACVPFCWILRSAQDDRP
jgi:hypothetical protein